MADFMTSSNKEAISKLSAPVETPEAEQPFEDMGAQSLAQALKSIAGTSSIAEAAKIVAKKPEVKAAPKAKAEEVPKSKAEEAPKAKTEEAPKAKAEEAPKSKVEEAKNPKIDESEKEDRPPTNIAAVFLK